LPAKKEAKETKDTKEAKDAATKEGSGSDQVDFSKFFTNLAVEDEPYFAMHPEFVVSPEEMRAFREDLRGCIIGRALANRFGWKPGDIFFLAAYPLLVLAAFGFVRAYREAGYPVGSKREHAVLGGILVCVFLVSSVRLLFPVVAQPGPLLERALTAAYPVLDFVLLVPILVLLRITAPFRGGQVFKAWAFVLVGIVALCAGDILYAYFTVLGREGLGPLVDATYVLAYLGVVLGTSEHRRLLAA